MDSGVFIREQHLRYSGVYTVSKSRNTDWVDSRCSPYREPNILRYLWKVMFLRDHVSYTSYRVAVMHKSFQPSNNWAYQFPYWWLHIELQHVMLKYSYIIMCILRTGWCSAIQNQAYSGLSNGCKYVIVSHDEIMSGRINGGSFFKPKVLCETGIFF